MTLLVPASPCRNCQCPTGYYAHGVGPHAAQLRCVSCHRQIRWLSKSEAPSKDVIDESMEAYGLKERAKQPSLFD